MPTRKAKRRRPPAKNATGKNAGAKKARGSARTEYETVYCYNEEERIAAVQRLSPNPRNHPIQGTRRDLGRRIQELHRPGYATRTRHAPQKRQGEGTFGLLHGKNTMERQNFIIDNLVIEEDIVDAATE